MKPGRDTVSPRRWLHLPLISPPRELYGTALLAFEAARRGWGVIVSARPIVAGGGVPEGLQWARNLAPGFPAETVKEMRRSGQRFVGMCEEGLLYPDAEEYRQRKIDRAAYDLMERWFTWGQNQFGDMAGLGFPEGGMAVTGSPRFDIHRADMRAALDAKADAIRRQHGPSILINTRFSRFNHPKGPEKLIELAQLAGRTETDAQIAHAHALVAFQAALFPKFEALIPALRSAFPTHTVIVRPHPAELLEPWIALAAKHPGVVVSAEGNVVDWLRAADVSIQNNCTTAVEAYLLGKPTVAYRPVHDDRVDLILPNLLSRQANDPDALLAAVGQAILGGERMSPGVRAEQDSTARRYVANVDDRTASAAIMDDLDGLDLRPHPLRLRCALGERMRDIARRAKRYALARDVAPEPRTQSRALRSSARLRRELAEFLDGIRRAGLANGEIELAAIDDHAVAVFQS